MTYTAKITTVGSSSGVVLPKPLLEKLRLERGDTVTIRETPEGVVLSAYDPEFEAQMAAAADVMRRRRNMLRELAQ